MKVTTTSATPDIQDQAVPIRDAQPSVQDLNRLIKFQRDLIEKITLNPPLEEVLDALCEGLETIIGRCYAAVMTIDKRDGTLKLASAPNMPEKHQHLLAGLKPGPQARTCGTSIFDDQPIFTTNTGTDAHWEHYRDLADTLNIRACWSYPLHENDNKAVGSISLFSDHVRTPNTFEARLLESAAHIGSIAISRHFSKLELNASEQRFSHIAASMPGVVLQIEFNDKQEPYFTYVSDGIKALCGISAAEALNQFDIFWNNLHPEDKNIFREYLKKGHLKSTLWTTECRVLDQHGIYKWVHFVSSSERDQFNNLKCINCIILDISKEKEAYAQLELAGIAFASTSEGIMVTNSEHCIVDVNRAYCEMTGYSRDELLGATPTVFDKSSDYRELSLLLEKQGYWKGEIWSRRKNGAQYPQWLNINAVYNLSGELTHYVSVAADVTNIRESEAKVRHMSQHDTLTDLPNLKLFKVLLDHAINYQSSLERIAVLMIDLDRFKHVNETMGHQAGDQLLIQVTDRLTKVLATEENSLLARVGGDEFAIMIPNCTHQGQAEQIAMRIVAALEDGLDLKGQNFYTTASIGITLYPEHGFDSETLIKNADTAVHQAKDLGRNNYTFYKRERTQIIEQWVKLEPDLRQALEREQFRVYFQPQIDASTGKISGAEALIRWIHPQEGLMSPGTFLPIIEEIGLMTKVGNWVLEQACIQLAQWQKLGLPSFRIAVNIAGQQILSHGFVEFVESMLEKHAISPDLLELEIVENIVVKNADAAKPVLYQLRGLGIRLALDDFGTGYSSLSYLKMLPVQKVKIDQSLVRDIPDDPNDEAIARAVIALSHSLNLSVCAEGVETQEQKVFLRREHCDQLQGYLISKPIPADQFTEWLHKHAASY